MDDLDYLEMDMASYRHDENHSSSYLAGEDMNARPLPVTCLHCGNNNLIWKKTERGWRTASQLGVVHNCSSFGA